MLNQVVRLLLLIHEENLNILAAVFPSDIANNIANKANSRAGEILGVEEEADTTARQPPEDEETSEEK
jgi:hypothetical protein